MKQFLALLVAGGFMVAAPAYASRHEFAAGQDEGLQYAGGRQEG